MKNICFTCKKALFGIYNKLQRNHCIISSLDLSVTAPHIYEQSSSCNGRRKAAAGLGSKTHRQTDRQGSWPLVLLVGYVCGGGRGGYVCDG